MSLGATKKLPMVIFLVGDKFVKHLQPSQYQVEVKFLLHVIAKEFLVGSSEPDVLIST